MKDAPLLAASTAPRDETEAYSTEVFCTPAELESIFPDWERLQKHANADRSFFQLIAGRRPEVIAQYVVAVRRGGEIVSLAVCRVENTAHPISFGYRRLATVRIRQLVVVHGGVMGDVSEPACRCLSDGLVRSFTTHAVDLIWLHMLRDDIPLRSMLHRAVPGACRDLFPVTRAHWRMALPASADGLFSNMNAQHRKNVRRLLRVLEREFPNRVRAVSYQSPSEVQEFSQQAASITAKSYLGAMGVGFVNDEEHRARLEFWAQRGGFLGYILFVHNRAVSFWVGTVFGAVYFVQATAFDPEFRKYEAGTALLGHVLGDLCSSVTRIEHVDFGLGDALYKRKFGTESWLESDTLLFAPTARGVGLNALRTPVLAADRGTKWVLQRWNLEQKAKTWLKRRAARTSQSAGA